jgi:hypothetical protein
MLVRNAIWSAWLRRPGAAALRRTWHVIRREPHLGCEIRGTLAALAGLSWIPFERQVVPSRVEHLLELLDNQATARVQTTATLTGIALAANATQGISTSEGSHG